MTHSTCYVKNISGQSLSLIKTLAVDEEYLIPDNMRIEWYTDNDVLSAITNDQVQIGSASKYFTEYSDQIDHLKNYDSQEANVNVTNSSVPTITFPHNKGHLGRLFLHSDFFTLSNRESKVFVVEPPSSGTRQPHFRYRVGVDNSTDIFLYEDSDAVLGSELTVFNRNRNRNSENTNTTRVYNHSSTNSVGTKIFSKRFGVGKNHHEESFVEGAEFILKTDTQYLFVIKSNHNGNDVSIELEWYEHDYLND